MTTGKSLALSAGLAGALVLGVWAAPRMIHRDAAPIAAPVADVADSAAPATSPAEMRCVGDPPGRRHSGRPANRADSRNFWAVTWRRKRTLLLSMPR